MREILFLVLLCFGVMSADVAQAEMASYEQQAEKIYDLCDKKTPQVDDEGVLSGSVADVQRERTLRQCLKEEVLKAVSGFVVASETERFRKALDGLEENAFMMYKTVLFCKKGGDKNWCEQYYKNDTALENLIVEKSVTSQMMKMLTDMLEIKQDGF